MRDIVRFPIIIHNFPFFVYCFFSDICRRNMTPQLRTFHRQSHSVIAVNTVHQWPSPFFSSSVRFLKLS